MLTVKANISASTTASQTPLSPNIAGSINIIAIWKSSVLKKDIIAETSPLFNAVKNDDAKILKPLIKYDIENILIAVVVISSKLLL